MTRALARSCRAAGAPLLVLVSITVSMGVAGPPALVLDWQPPATPDATPPGWEPLHFKRIDKKTRYEVVPDGGAYVLRAESDAGASGLYRPLDLDPAVYRILSWRWRVENLLARADARRKDGDDYPARVYVAFRYDPHTATAWERTTYGALKLFYGRYPPRHAINYVWDNRLPPGTALDNAYTDRAKMIIVESGPDRVGRWVSEERNVYEDYRRLFGAEAPRIAGVAVMTDTDDTRERAVAYYGSLTLRPVQ